MIHGDSVYDIIDKQDHGSIQAELSRSVPQQTTGSGSHHSLATSLDGERRMFLCRMNVSRNARRQMRFGDQKVRRQNVTKRTATILQEIEIDHPYCAMARMNIKYVRDQDFVLAFKRV